LKVENTENYPITKCYARLINATYLHGSSMVSKDYGQERFKWMETKESNDLCEIEIPRKDFKRIDVGYGDMSFRFSFCEEDKKQGILGHRLYAVRIRVDGDGIEPVFFDGYVFVYQEVFYYKKTEMIDGKETKPEMFEEYSPRMIFKAGDWRQDEVVQEYLKKWNEAYQEFRNE